MWRCFSRAQRYSKVLRAASSESHCRQKASSDPLHRPRLTVCIEGNIGSGKTTLLEHFSQFPNVEITWEDVDSWCDVEGYNLLQMAYQDSSRWAHLLQTYAQLTFATGHGKGVSDGSKVKLMERSIHSARYCFLENQYRSGIITEAEYLVACYWYRQLTSITDCQADLVVYLRTNPQSCYDRVMGRGRPEEVGLPLQLLQDLHERHEEWLLEERFPTYGPVTVLNANADLPAMLKEYYTLEAFLAGTADKS
ncbi:thymidine kinase 2, mitochondrial-like [Portunus trituberculatus]|uniref:Thymidine kinase 2, mitochondrial n=1 Tax=Portunus trituberculatus TaxID=210409 RepID=A0A5B7DC59_PORTR|nr:thymidine kinase 2, mitochondrial-like [Portunus trituberculatus]MPC18938.1 Thymidine kinase 2, mitochondrial [Portunus trituberculatus]